MISVLIVDDDPIAVEAHSHYVARMPGFQVSGRASSAREAMLFLTSPGKSVDLVLLDVNMPDATGLAVVRKMRSLGIMTDVIAVTGVRELATLRTAVSLGVLHYVLKPFTFATLAEKLQAYADYRRESSSRLTAVSQGQIDSVVSQLHSSTAVGLPKGLSQDVLGNISHQLEDFPLWCSAQDLATAVGVSRVTARRYVEYLVSISVAMRRSRAGAHGRPTVEYRWARVEGSADSS